ncbi:MAG: penicillin-binding protein 2 [Candidatus Omnitrophica bacterium]|nr:penicillin-binding protein 2 [Candidatus Omnitrophota bacterium]
MRPTHVNVRTTNDRIAAVLLIGLGLLGVLWLRCLWLQVVSAPQLSAIARAQHQATQPLRASRGAIFDRSGTMLAVSIPVPSVYANARQVTGKREMANRLAKMTGRSADRIRERLERDKGFVWVARQVDHTVMSPLATMRDEGIGVLEELKRFYPHGRMAGHLLGFVDVDQQGLEGLELTLNGVLKGQDGWRATLRDAKGDLLIGPWTTQTDPVDGYDVVLTIDSIVQQAAEESLAWGVKKYHAKGGSIIVMDPDTGAILAMANAPSFDANKPAEAPADFRRNRAVTDLFEPGSTFKVVTAAALIEEGRITPEEPVFCENGSYPTVARHVLHDHRPHGALSFHDVVAYSSNIGTAKAAQRLKPDELYRHIRAFGFGQKTGVDLPGEVSGILSPPSRWSRLSPFIVPIGQEIAVTPLQLAVMTAVIANGGFRVRPFIVDRVQTPDGRVVRSHAQAAPVRIISSETAHTVQRMLVSVVESGTGQLANVQGLTVAGKTGTAQKLEPTGRYSHSRFVASFVGLGPVPDSRFVIVICVDEPRPLYFGGVVSAPMFKRVVEQLAAYWELPRQSAAGIAVKAPGSGVVAKWP